jgi:cytochrome P450
LTTSTAIAASSSIDLFNDAVLADPYPVYETLREMGPAVYLPQHHVWVVTGHDDVHAALTDPETFSSVDGIALTDLANREILAGTVLAADGAGHARLRRPLSQQLNPRAMRALTETIRVRAQRVVADFVRRIEFDAADLAQAFVADIVMELMGLPESTRSQLITNAKATFEMFGPANARYWRAAPAAAAMIAFLHEEVNRETVRPGSWMHSLYLAADAGQIDESDVVPLMSAYTAAGMDTTIYAISTALHLLAEHPDQWMHLRTRRATGEQVFREAIRLDAPIQGFGRRVTRDTTIAGVPIPAGDQVWLSYGAAGRDPSRWGTHADRFDAQRTGTEDHLALGAGPHLCAGNHLAESEATSLLTALATRCTRINLAGEPVRAFNNTLRGWEHLPLKVVLDRRFLTPADA